MQRIWKFSLEFLPVMNLNMSTTLLEEKVLFEMQIIRPWDDTWVMFPKEATLTRMKNGPQLPAKLLNPKLTEIYPKSSYRIVWILPYSKPSQGSYEHQIILTYNIMPVKAEDCDVPMNIFSRDYLFMDEAFISAKGPSYELCAQLLSSQPGAALCRIDNECDMIISLRSLTNQVETIMINLDSDPTFWDIRERNKFLCVKESGLGQISFSIIPKMVGFLPYPSINIYCCADKRMITFCISFSQLLKNLFVKFIKNYSYEIIYVYVYLCLQEKSSTIRDEIVGDFNEKIVSFVRTSDKQVHVLGPFASTSEQRVKRGEKSGRLKEAKSRISKFFEQT
ncbi:unnamed protein product [Dracunculus medinensis]|uniref:Uncharacterized protein n=1 Tax=Dracunculus medinensis TaxID=318479 RepID=A0A3P7PVK5_DRAME|nr:unnamed protein product [Dracunculus medinensis]